MRSALAWILALVPMANGLAQESTPRPDSPLIVGTKEAPPFSFRDGEGEWRGLSIDLWQNIATALEIPFELREFTLEELVNGLAEGTIDVGVAALTVTPEREIRIDFTHPFHPSGLGIALPAGGGSRLGILRGLVSSDFLRAAGTLAVLIFGAGLVVWLFERRRNPQFGGKPAKGIGSGFWWSAVTMTTVGYGDKAPVTLLGRVVAVIWMFAGIIMISGLTAAIASTLTVAQLEQVVSGPGDLPSLGRIATVRGSTSEHYLRDQRLSYEAFDRPEEALRAVADGTLRAAVYDAPILRYLAETKLRDEIVIPPVVFERQSYAFGLPIGSPYRRPINRALVEQLSGDAWDDTLFRYLGSGR
jgi:ABC-type amino acid transport substrate-binding protein